MSSSLRRSQPAMAAAAAATLKRPLLRTRALCSSSAAINIGQPGHVKHMVAAQQLRHDGSRGSGGGVFDDERAHGGAADGATGGSAGDPSPGNRRATAPRRSGSKEISNPATSPAPRTTTTTTTAPSSSASASLGRGGGTPPQVQQQRSAHDSAASDSRRSKRPPLFFSSAVVSGGTPTQPLPATAGTGAAMRAPMSTAGAMGALSVVAGGARGGGGSSQLASHVRKPAGGIPCDSAVASSSSSSSSSFGRGGGGTEDGSGIVGGGTSRGDITSLHGRSRRVFSSLPADDHSSGGADGVRLPPPPSPQQQQQQQQNSPPLSPRISVADEELLATYSALEATPLSLRDIHAFCQSTTASSRMMQARFLHREVPIRFAKRAQELRNLPYGLSHTAPVVEATEWFARIMRELVECPVPDGPDGDAEFATFLSSLLKDHTCVPQALSRGVLELQEKGEVGLIQRHRIDRILDNFFISRISLRFLVDTYISSKRNKPGFSGVIESECSPVLVAWRAAADVDRLCRFHMGTAPAIEVFGRAQDTFTAVPSHLYYILREVLKNSCRATVEHGRRTRPGEKLPPVKIIVARGNEDMTIKIVDEGGGIRRSDLQRVWSYMYSTAPRPTASQLTGVPLDHMSGMRLKEEGAALESSSESEPGSAFAFAGYGMGLPLSRLYARYFGGSLKLRPMEGYGTDAYIHLHRLRTNSEELLPNSVEETLRIMADDGRVNVTRSRSWKQPANNDDAARELIRSFGEGL